MTNLERAVKDLQDNLVVISEIERRQSELLKVHSERLVLIEAVEFVGDLFKVDRGLRQAEIRATAVLGCFRLIGYVSERPPSPPSP